jgi:predicted lipid-binding transport protein (Tim44 family)
MAHIYMTFDFGTDEEKAQQARHKVDGWKQAFRLDKKLIYKFERSAQGGDGVLPAEPTPAKKETAKAEKPAKGAKAGKAGGAAKAKAQKEEEKPTAPAAPSGAVKLHLRLAFSGHEKMTEERWLKRIPTEEPFKEAAPETVKASDPTFGEIEGKFESLEG